MSSAVGETHALIELLTSGVTATSGTLRMRAIVLSIGWIAGYL